LGAAGRRFLTQMLAQSDVDLVQGVLLVEAAHCLDGLATWRAAAQTDKQAARLALAHQKTFAALLAQMRV
jgi:ACR3 family arsenite efflux pump ArsB